MQWVAPTVFLKVLNEISAVSALIMDDSYTSTALKKRQLSNYCREIWYGAKVMSLKAFAYLSTEAQR